MNRTKQTPGYKGKKRTKKMGQIYFKKHRRFVRPEKDNQEQ